MKNFIKKIASKILSAELAAYDNRVNEITQDRDALVSQCGELNGQIKRLTVERNRYKNRIAASLKYVLPNGVVAKIISVLPNPNEVADKMEKSLAGRDYIIKGSSVPLSHGGIQNWFFEVKFEKLEKISDVKIMLHVTLRNNMGTAHLGIPAVIDHLGSATTTVDTWVWNLWEAGLAVLPDDLYGVLYRANSAWTNVMHELGL